jgi:eukaryotic-like serine/threonine-protein kinase
VPLTAGSRLGPYEILALIGAGGMGEVYKARDTRLERTVAVKVLPSDVASSPEQRQRFEREAKTISQLSHPHICALYDVGNQDGTEYLVMEYLEGETLAGRLAKGSLPLEQTLRYGTEITGALDKAHRQGIVHRDLKPGNVMLTSSGVKLLDFGLAKAVQPASQISGLSVLPTQAGANLTQEGTILGTFQYMAPEQLEGKEADARSDIFAFGAVLYEMATGKKAFSGATQASLISSILRDDPQPISQVQPMSPSALDRVVKGCLAKDPEDRLQSAHDVASELKWIAEGSGIGVAPPTSVAPHRTSHEWIAWGIAALAVTGALAWTLFSVPSTPATMQGLRVSVLPPDGSTSYGPFAVSPDGRQVAFVATGVDGRDTLYVRSLDSLEARSLLGTDEAAYPFWSPDGASLGFFAKRKLKRIDVGGGPPRDLTDVTDPRGGTWGRDGIIVFAPSGGSGLVRITATGGAVTAVTELDTKRQETSHRWPHFLPDGKHVLFLKRSPVPSDRFAVEVASLDSKDRIRLVDAPSPAEYADGRLFFVRGTTLMSQAFDAKGLRVSGDPVSVAEGVWVDIKIDGLLAFSVAPGLVAYRRGGFASTRLTWFSRDGKLLRTVGPPRVWDRPALSPDGRRIAVEDNDPATNIANVSLVDDATGTASRFTFGNWNDTSSAWSPAGDRIAFSSDRQGPFNLYVKPVSGAGEPTLLVSSPNWGYAESWSHDGRFLAYRELDPKTKGDLWVLPMMGKAKPSAFLNTPANEKGAEFSPDGRFLAYDSDESGLENVYVQTFPASGAKWQASSAGGSSPRWRRDGKELYYVSPDKRIMAVPITLSQGGLQPGIPHPLFAVSLPPFVLSTREYDVSADGERFLVNVPADDAITSPIALIMRGHATGKSP